jgi:hypothetical protein
MRPRSQTPQLGSLFCTMGSQSLTVRGPKFICFRKGTTPWNPSSVRSSSSVQIAPPAVARRA